MDIFLDGDICSLGFLIVVLLAVGGTMIKSRPDLDQWGHRLAAVAFVAYVIVGGIETKGDEASDWAALAFRGLFAAGFVLGVTWIALPILAFIHQHTIRRPAERAHQWRNEAEQRRRDVDAKREVEKQAAIRQAEWKRSAPEREQARLQAENNARIQADSQRRREDARAAALLSYSFYSAKLGGRFSRKMFDQYVETYMGDKYSPDIVERRGNELLAIFERHLADVQPPPRSTTIESLTRWYERIKGQITAMPIDPEAKEVRLADLERRFDELLSSHLEDIEP